jgi:hypothetical protein
MAEEGIIDRIKDATSPPVWVFLILTLFLLLGFLAGYPPADMTAKEMSLEIQLSPDAYPLAGGEWTVTVWKIETNKARTPAEGAIIRMLNGTQEVYQKIADEEGKASFEYRNEYSRNVAFHASLDDFKDAHKIPEGTIVNQDQAQQILDSFAWSAFGIMLAIFFTPILIIFTIKSLSKNDEDPFVKAYGKPNVTWGIISCGLALFVIYSIGFLLGQPVANDYLASKTAWGFLYSTDFETLLFYWRITFISIYIFIGFWFFTAIYFGIYLKLRPHTEESEAEEDVEGEENESEKEMNQEGEVGGNG